MANYTYYLLLLLEIKFEAVYGVGFSEFSFQNMKIQQHKCWNKAKLWSRCPRKGKPCRKPNLPSIHHLNIPS